MLRYKYNLCRRVIFPFQLLGYPLTHLSWFELPVLYISLAFLFTSLSISIVCFSHTHSTRAYILLLVIRSLLTNADIICDNADIQDLLFKMRPVLVLPYFPTDIPREEWTVLRLKDQRRWIRRGLPIAVP